VLGGADDTNRAFNCPTCTLAKSDRTTGADPRTGRVVTLFNPRSQRWDDHFRWVPRVWRILGRTATCRATVSALRMNDAPLWRAARRLWFQAGWLP